MRKRQWKKILSVVLALAMVFSMNVSAFADEVTDPVAVEEPAAEQLAETPAAEEPAPAEEEAPAAEEPAPAEEAAPVEEKAPEKGEEPAAANATNVGETVTKVGSLGWTLGKGRLGDSETVLGFIESTSTIIAFPGIGNNVTLTPNSGYEANTINITAENYMTADDTISVNGIAGAAGTISVEDDAVGIVYLGADSYAVYSTFSENGLYLPGARLPKGTYHVFKTDTSVTGTLSYETEKISTTATYTVRSFLADGTFVATITDDSGYRNISSVVPANDDGTAVEDNLVVIKNAEAYPSYKVITIKQRQQKPDAPVLGTASKTQIAVTATTSNEVGFSTSSGTGYDATGVAESPAGTFKKTGLTEGTTYYIAQRVPYGASEFASDWSEEIAVVTQDKTDVKKDTTFDVDTDTEYTVSGLKVTTGSDAKGKFVSDNKTGIFTVDVEEGTVTIEGGTAANKAVSVNLASEKSIAILDASSSNFKGELISIKGTGLVTVKKVAGTGSKIASVATGVSISGNAGGNDGIVVSNNKAYLGVETGVDTAVKVTSDTLPTTIYAATNTADTVFATITDTMYRENYVTAKEGYVVSAGNALGKIGDKNIDLTKNTTDPSFNYGAKVWWIPTAEYNSGTPNGSFVFDKIPERNEQGITSVAVYDENIGQSSAKFHVVAPSTLNKVNISANYKFAISTDSASFNDVSLLSQYVAPKDADNTYFDDGEYIYTLDEDHLLKGTAVKEGTAYKIFVMNTTSGKFYSAPAEVGSFTTNAKQTLTIAKPTVTVYAGDQDAKGHNVAEAGVIPLTFDSTKIDYEKGEVYKDDVFIGTVGYYFLPSKATGITSAKIAAFNGAKDDSDFGAATEDVVQADGTLSGNYYVKAFFTDGAGVYDSVSSATISFDIAPVTVAPSVKDSKHSIAEKKLTHTDENKASDGGFLPEVKYINKITGKAITDDSTYIDETKVVFVQGESATGTTNLTNKTVSLNKGSYKYSVSNGSVKIADGKLAPYAAKYVIDWAAAEAGDLDVFGEATLTAEAITVPYGTADVDAGNKDIKNNLVVKLDSTGTAEATKDFTMKFFDKKAISDNGKEISNNSLEIAGGDVKTKDAGEEFYVVATYNGSKCTGEKPKSAPVLVTIVKRDITIGGKANPIGHSKRNIEIKDSQVSFNAADFKGTLVSNAKFDYKNTANTKFESPLSANTSGKLNKADIDITKAKTYPARITEYKLDPDVDKNFNVTVAEASYKIDPAYYAYWILEYAGRGAITGKKLISFNEATETNIDKPAVGYVKHVMPADITASWNEAGKSLFAGTGDYISAWEAKGADGYEYPGLDSTPGADSEYKSKFAFDELNADGKYVFDYTLSQGGDVYFYAVVTAKATENVTIESIAPVVYNGKKYVGNSYTDKQSKTAISGAEVKLTDITKRVIDPATGLEKTGYDLVYGKDFKVTYKNNVNASVKINPALSENLSAEAGVASAVEQLFKENKRPQAVVTGIGDYKGLKATVYFDIYPKRLEGDYFTGLYTSPTLNITKINKNGKGIKYKYKVGDEIKGKTVTLKNKKDYTETFYSVPDLTKMNQKTVADARKITAAGKYALIIDGTKNYRGQIVIHFDVKDKSEVLMSELGFKGKKVAYKGSTISSDSTGFNIKASKKVGTIKGSQLKNGTDFTIGGVDTDNDLLQLTIKDGMPVEAGSYYFNVEPTKALLDKGVIDDGVKVTVKIKNKVLKANQFKVEGWPKTYTGNSDDVRITSKKLRAGTDYYAFPTSFTSTVQLEKNGIGTKAGVGDVVGFAVDDIKDAFDNDGDYVGGETPKEVLEAYAELPNIPDSVRDLGKYYSGITYSGFVWKLTAKNGSKRFTYTLVPKNDLVYSGYVNVIGKGAYAGSVVQVPYARKGANLKNATISVDKCFANINGTEPAVYIVIPTDDGKGKPIRVDNDKAYTVKYSNNKKASAKAKVIVKNSGVDGCNAEVLGGAQNRLAEFTGTQSKIFTIDRMPIKSVSALSLAAGKSYAQLANSFYATVEDAAAANNGFKEPKVTVYQYSEDGKKRTALKYKKEFGIAYDTAKITDNAISLNACAKQDKSSFSIEKPVTVDGATFNVYEKKAKKYKLKISGYKSISASGVSKNATYDEKKKGVVYTGERIEPVIGSLVVDGETFVSGGVSNNKVGSYELVITENDLGKVGVVKYQILLKKASGVKYTLGGSKQFTFKIIPQENNKLILSE